MKSKTYIIKYITKSANQTRKIGEKMAKEIVLASPKSRRGEGGSPTTTLNRGERWGRGFSLQRKGAIVLAMQGDLGGGKTTFIQGFARGLGIEENITSPTFVILKVFKITKSKIQMSNVKPNPKSKAQNRNSKFKISAYRAGRQNSKFFYHIDCYRIEKSGDLLDLGIKNILSDRNNIVAIEWSEKVQKILPKHAIKIKFEFVDENTRKITIK
jgi:tRNA threonylcarbamoyladenosine biosynthesis protein TsaE